MPRKDGRRRNLRVRTRAPLRLALPRLESRESRRHFLSHSLVYLQRSARYLEGHSHDTGGRKFSPPSRARQQRGREWDEQI